MNFPLFRRPGSVVFLDDDSDYLDSLAMVLPRHWPVRLFTRPAQCIHHLHREIRLWEIDLCSHHQMIDLWRQGKSLIPQILTYWSRNTERHALTHVCVVDFSMPGMDGLQVLSELAGWPGRRVLLTGQADERVAVGAFNRGLIDHFIPKQTDDIARQVTEVIQTQSDRAQERHDLVWRATFRPDQLALLGDADIRGALQAFFARHWVEYAVIGQPFGAIGLDAAGHASWLQLETREGLEGMAELAGLQGLEGQALQDIRKGRSLVSIELRQALDLHGAGAPVPAFHPGGSGLLLAALCPVPQSALPAPVMGHHEWLARHQAGS